MEGVSDRLAGIPGASLGPFAAIVKCARLCGLLGEHPGETEREDGDIP